MGRPLSQYLCAMCESSLSDTYIIRINASSSHEVKNIIIIQEIILQIKILQKQYTSSDIEIVLVQILTCLDLVINILTQI